MLGVMTKGTPLVFLVFQIVHLPNLPLVRRTTMTRRKTGDQDNILIPRSAGYAYG